jgi:hypothetical protein
MPAARQEPAPEIQTDAVPGHKHGLRPGGSGSLSFLSAGYSAKRESAKKVGPGSSPG